MGTRAHAAIGLAVIGGYCIRYIERGVELKGDAIDSWRCFEDRPDAHAGDEGHLSPDESALLRAALRSPALGLRPACTARWTMPGLATKWNATGR